MGMVARTCREKKTNGFPFLMTPTLAVLQNNQSVPLGIASDWCLSLPVFAAAVMLLLLMDFVERLWALSHTALSW